MPTLDIHPTGGGRQEPEFSEKDLWKVREPESEIEILKITVIYERAFMQFGLLPLLMLLDEYEELERYNECFCIKQAIENVNYRHKFDNPTKYGNEAINQIKAWHIENKKDFSAYLRRVPYYTLGLFNYVNQKRNGKLQ